jgi:hypothetical protein
MSPSPVRDCARIRCEGLAAAVVMDQTAVPWLTFDLARSINSRVGRGVMWHQKTRSSRVLLVPPQPPARRDHEVAMNRAHDELSHEAVVDAWLARMITAISTSGQQRLEPLYEVSKLFNAFSSADCLRVAGRGQHEQFGAHHSDPATRRTQFDAQCDLGRTR